MRCFFTSATRSRYCKYTDQCRLVTDQYLKVHWSVKTSTAPFSVLTPVTVNDMLPEMTLYESIVDRRQWETSQSYRIEAEDLKSVCSSAEGELETKLCFCQSEILE